VRHALFGPSTSSNGSSPSAPECPPGHFQLALRSEVFVSVFGEVDKDYARLLKWKEIDEKEGHLWFKVFKELLNNTTFDHRI
jgi:hypothetical protein